MTPKKWVENNPMKRFIDEDEDYSKNKLVAGFKKTAAADLVTPAIDKA